MASSKPVRDSNPQNHQQSSGANIQVEIAINVGEPNDFDRINNLLESKGHKVLSSDFGSKTIGLELGDKVHDETSNLQDLQKFIENETGYLAVIRGIGEFASAVTELRPSDDANRDGNPIHGVIRLSQLNGGLCYVDGSVEGHRKPDHVIQRSHMLSLAIHEFGNLEGSSFESIGEPLIDIHKKELDDSRISVSKVIPDCHVADLIGRSIALTRWSPDSPLRTTLSAGVVARASTVHKNKKQVCSCSGKTLWEERMDKKKSELDGH